METVEAGSKSLEVAVMEKVWGRQGPGRRCGEEAEPAEGERALARVGRGM